MARIEARHGNDDPISGFVGNIIQFPDKLARGQNPFKRMLPREMEEYVEKHFGGENWRDKLQINFNHSPMWQQLKRLFQKGRRTNLFVRSTLGVVTTAATALISRLTRRDYYNPFSHSVQVYHPEKSIVMKQVAMAHDYDQSKIPTLRALGTLGGLLPAVGLNVVSPPAVIDSWRASKSALEHMPEADKIQARKILEPEFVFDMIGGKWIVLPALFPLALIYKFTRSGKRSIFFDREKHGKLPQDKKVGVQLSRQRLALAA